MRSYQAESYLAGNLEGEQRSQDPADYQSLVRQAEQGSNRCPWQEVSSMQQTERILFPLRIWINHRWWEERGEPGLSPLKRAYSVFHIFSLYNLIIDLLFDSNLNGDKNETIRSFIFEIFVYLWRICSTILFFRIILIDVYIYFVYYVLLLDVYLY